MYIYIYIPTVNSDLEGLHVQCERMLDAFFYRFEAFAGGWDTLGRLTT